MTALEGAWQAFLAAVTEARELHASGAGAEVLQGMLRHARELLAVLDDELAANHPLIGNWRYSSDTSCVESYDFRADGSFSSTSGSDSIEGRYTIESPARGRYKVTRTITHDNHLADCNGFAADNTGASDVRYVTFSRDRNVLRVCPTAVSNECFGPLARVKAQ